jgi:hypothetical protein
MTNEYGQQPYPGQQPYQGGQQQPQQGYGYPQTPAGGQPVYAGQPYPQQQPGYGPAPVEKPGAVTGAAVLGFIQAGLTLITTGILFFGLIGTSSTASAAGTDTTMGWVVALAQLAGLVLLIFGAVQLMSGTSRGLYLIGAGVELAICLYYLISIVASDTGGLSVLADMKAAATVIPIVFAVMPLIGLILALGQGTSRYIQAKRGR